MAKLLVTAQEIDSTEKIDEMARLLRTQANTINHARKLVAGKELTHEQKKQFFLKENLPTLLEFIADIDPKFVETLTPEQRKNFSVKELDVLGKELLFKWVEQLTPEQRVKWIEQLKHEQYVVTQKQPSVLRNLLDITMQWWERVWGYQTTKKWETKETLNIPLLYRLYANAEYSQSADVNRELATVMV